MNQFAIGECVEYGYGLYRVVSHERDDEILIKATCDASSILAPVAHVKKVINYTAIFRFDMQFYHVVKPVFHDPKQFITGDGAHTHALKKFEVYNGENKEICYAVKAHGSLLTFNKDANYIRSLTKDARETRLYHVGRDGREWGNGYNLHLDKVNQILILTTISSKNGKNEKLYLIVDNALGYISFKTVDGHYNMIIPFAKLGELRDQSLFKKTVKLSALRHVFYMSLSNIAERLDEFLKSIVKKNRLFSQARIKNIGIIDAASAAFTAEELNEVKVLNEVEAILAEPKETQATHANAILSEPKETHDDEAWTTIWDSDSDEKF